MSLAIFKNFSAHVCVYNTKVCLYFAVVSLFLTLEWLHLHLCRLYFYHVYSQILQNKRDFFLHFVQFFDRECSVDEEKNFILMMDNGK